MTRHQHTLNIINATLMILALLSLAVLALVGVIVSFAGRLLESLLIEASGTLIIAVAVLGIIVVHAVNAWATASQHARHNNPFKKLLRFARYLLIPSMESAERIFESRRPRRRQPGTGKR